MNEKLYLVILHFVDIVELLIAKMNFFRQMDVPAFYRQSFRCFSFAMFQGEQDKGNLEYGAKILMPPSALEELSHMNVEYPMLFAIRNKQLHRETHCGVLEFTAEEGQVFIPYWMMRNLLLGEGDIVEIQLTSLPVAKFIKFEPQSPEFLEIENPKAVLERVLRNFATLTVDDIIPIKHADKIYELRVVEAKPQKAVSIIETDTEVDFIPPVGYVEPERPKKNSLVDADIEREQETQRVLKELESKEFKPFQGSGSKISGKSTSSSNASNKASSLAPATM